MLTTEAEKTLSDLCAKNELKYINVCAQILEEVKEEVTDVSICDEIIETDPTFYTIICKTKDGNKEIEYEAIEQGEYGSDEEKGVDNFFNSDNDSESSFCDSIS